MSFVKSILEMSLAGGVMIAAVIAVRALTLKRLPKRTFPVLWYAALARLLVPLSLPCTLSVFTLWERLSEAPAAAEPVTVSVPAVVPAAPVAPVYAPPPPAVNAPPPVAVDAPVSFSINGETVAILLWLLGVIVCAAFFTVVYLRSRREFNQSLPLENDFVRSWLDGHRLRRKISLRQSDRIGAPLTYGVLRPVILMPKCTDWDDGEAVKYVLEHEFAHIRRFDAAGKLVLTAAVCLHWFNPLVWGMYVLANRDLELACDESVLRRLGRETRAEYAMTLIRMAEAEGKNGPAPLCSGFGKSAVEERITAIMKMKKTSLAALLMAVVLVLGVTTVFATSAATADKEELDRRANAQTVTSMDTVMSITGEDGKTWYSTDGGKTWISEEEFDAAHPKTEVEWWTYDEYAAWLENEKAELQDMLGEKGWTGSRGEFVWTQEEIDKTIAMYEEILEQIGRGMLVSKTVNGSENTMLMQNPYDILMGIGEGEPTAADFVEYEPYGLEWRETEKALFFKGERVRYFIDGAELDVGMAVRFEYADAELRGDIDVRAVRSRVDNGDGSYDPTGPLVRLEKFSQAEFDANTFTVPALEAEAYTQAVTAEDEKNTAAVLDKYVPFGLSYEFYPNSVGTLNMSYNGKPVHALSDAAACVWVANSMNGFYLGPDAVDLEAVYTNGKLTGLKASPAPATQTVTIDGESYAPAIGLDAQGNEIHGYVRRSDLGDVAANPAEALEYMKNLNTAPRDIPLYDEAGKVIGTFTVGSIANDPQTAATTTVISQDTGSGKAEPGRTFADIFAKYEPIRIVYEEAEGASGKGNVYRLGNYIGTGGKCDRYLISHFVDVAPDGSVFTFDSALSGGLSVQTVYREDGTLMELTVTASPVTAEPLKNGEMLVEVSGLFYSHGWTGGGYVRAADFDPKGGLVPFYDEFGNCIGCFNNADSVEHNSEYGAIVNHKFMDGFVCIMAVGTGTDGTYPTDGYIREFDTFGPLHYLETPEEVMEYINANPDYAKRREIPLYDDNGKVIGSFECGGGFSLSSSDFSSIDEARDYLRNYGNDE